MSEILKQKGCTCFNLDKVKLLIELKSEMDFTVMSKVFKAVGHEKRLTVLYLISKESLCVCDLANTMESPVSTMSQYLRILKEAGLIYDEQQHKFLIYKLTELGNKVIGKFIYE